MSDPLVTVIIPTYNRADTLVYAVDSVLWQTYQHFELLVVGDCCTDHTDEVMQKYLEDPRVQWINLPENSGYQSVPNNEGLKRAKGEYVCYLNHDDIWLPNHLQDCVEGITEVKADFGFTILQWVYSFTVSRPDIPLLPYLPKPPEVTAVIHRRDVVDRIGYWKNIDETWSYPRVEFFRRGFYEGLSFQMIPRLTALKFLWDEESYSDTGPQPLYFKRIREEKDFYNKELSEMLVRANNELYRFTTRRRRKDQIGDWIRIQFIKRKIDPASLTLWRGKGHRIRVWRKRHRLV